MPRTCKICKTKFEPKFNQVQMCCSILCAIEYSKRQKSKAWKKEKKVLKEKLQTVQELTKIAQAVFNTFIRMRDKGKSCICCGEPLGERFDAGHYYSAGGHPYVRFDEDNVHGQRSRPCNKDLSGNLINYREGLIDRIGEDRLKRLKTICHKERKYTREELKDIITTYRLKIKKLKL